MSIIYFDGFETYSTTADVKTNWDTSDVSNPLITASGFNNSRAMSITGYSSFYGNTVWWADKKFTDTRYLSVGAAIQFLNFTSIGGITGSNVNPVIELRNGSNRNLCIFVRYVNSTYQFVATKTLSTGTSDIIAASSYLTRYDINAWHYYEVEIDSSTSGYARLYLDGNKILEIPSYDFSAGSVQAVNTIRLHAAQYNGSQSSTQTTYFDDFYITDQPNRLGQIQVKALRPSADTAQKDWTPSTGTANFSLINSPGSQTTTFVSSATEDATDLYTMDDIATDPSKVKRIYGIKPVTTTSKADIGDTTMNAILSYNSNLINFPKIQLNPSSYRINYNILEKNPVTNLDWTADIINQTNIGVTTHLESNKIAQLVNGQLIVTAGASALVAGDTYPTIANNSLVFTGTQRIRYTDSSFWRASDPFSIELEFQTTTPASTQVLFNIGGDLSTNYPEIMINVISGGIAVHTNTNNASPNQTNMLIPINTLAANTNYRVGVMVYNSGGLRIRGYFNGYATFDQSINSTPPRDSTGGVSIGASLGSGSYLTGTIKTLSVGRSLFWKI